MKEESYLNFKHGVSLDNKIISLESAKYHE